MNTENKTKNGITVTLKKWQLFIAVIGFLLGNAAFAVSWKVNTDNKIDQSINERENIVERIKRLEIIDRKEHDLLLELKFNLQTLMEAGGLKYKHLTK